MKRVITTHLYRSVAASFSRASHRFAMASSSSSFSHSSWRNSSCSSSSSSSSCIRPLPFISSRRAFSTCDYQLLLTDEMLKILDAKILSIESRHAELQSAGSRPDASPDEMARTNKELSRLEGLILCIREMRSKEKEIEDLETVWNESMNDIDLHKMAAEELEFAVKEKKKLKEKILMMILPKDVADTRGCILEVRAGTGGEEACLFAMDLFKMYECYAEKNLWKFEIMDVAETSLRGCKEASALITGADVYGRLKFESGVHRVQRVPMTEKSGRVHTSAASVAILPQAHEVDVQIRNEDLRIDTYRASGAGGQHVNTTSSAVRITHVPTGITVAIQDQRSQHQNKNRALQILRAKLFELERMRIHSSRSELRQEQIGSGDRSERVRTYNFPQGRVTDHRVGLTQHSIEQFMEGEGLDTFLDALLLKQEIDSIALLKLLDPLM